MLIWVGFFTLGLIVGGVAAWFVIMKRDIVGTIFFYDAEPGEPPMLLSELNETPENIGKHDYVTFKVSHK